MEKATAPTTRPVGNPDATRLWDANRRLDERVKWLEAELSIQKTLTETGTTGDLALVAKLRADNARLLEQIRLLEVDLDVAKSVTGTYAELLNDAVRARDEALGITHSQQPNGPRLRLVSGA